MSKFFNKRETLFFFALFIGIALAGGATVWATSIGTDLTVSGILTNTGAATFSSTIAVTSTGTFTANVVVNSTTATSTFSSGGLAVATSKFVVQQASGNVGIGTSNPSTALDVLGTASSSALVIGGVGGGTTLNHVVSGYCSLVATVTINASTTLGTICTVPSGTAALSSSDRVLVMATSSLPSNFIIQSASSTGATTIGVQIFNTGYSIYGGTANVSTAAGSNSFNFWAFR